MSSVSDRLHWHWPTRLSINRELYSNSGLTLGFSHLSVWQGPAHAARRFGGMYSRPQQLCNFNLQLRTQLARSKLFSFNLQLRTQMALS